MFLYKKLDPLISTSTRTVSTANGSGSCVHKTPDESDRESMLTLSFDDCLSAHDPGCCSFS